MRNTQANRLARWAAIIAAVITVIVVGVYLRRSWQAREEAKHGPPPVPAAVERNSEGYQYTQMNGTRPLLTIRASNVTQLKEGDRSLFSNVGITLYGRKGDRSDSVHSQSCDYVPSDSRLVCGGEVQMDLESAEDARKIAAAAPGSASGTHPIHVSTRGVTFDRNTGDASTDEPVKFSFPGGEGTAIGARYTSESGTFAMRREIHVTLTPIAAHAATSKSAPVNTATSPITLTGSSLEFRHESRMMVLRGPVVARQEAQKDASHAASVREMHANLVTVNMDKELHARRVTLDGDAGTRPNVQITGVKGNGNLTADQFVADLGVEGWLERFSALGNTVGDYKTPVETNHVTANRVVGEMVPKINQPRSVTANGAVKIESSRGSKSKKMETASLVLDFVAGPAAKPGARQKYRPSLVRSLTPGTVTLNEPAMVKGKPVNSVTGVTGQQLEAAFDAHKKIHKILAHNGTQLDRDLTGRPHQTSTSQEMSVDFDADGQWTTLDQTGNVHMRDGDRTGQAANARADHATNLVTLSGSAEAADAATHTNADTIIFNQQSDDIRADGHVLTTYRKVPGATANSGMGVSLNFGPEPTHITSEHLTGNSKSGIAVYTGHARLWQGDSTMEADEIELNRDARQLDARGNFRGVFLAVSSTPPNSTANGTAPAPRAENTSAPATLRKPELWRVRSSTLTYRDAESKAHLAGGFTAESQRSSLAGRAGDLFFAPPTPGASGGSQRMDHAVAIGNVTVKKDDTRGTAERGEYDAKAGTFVLSGGNPILYDASGNSTRGRQLTFYLADDTILVESEGGKRTLTRHQVKN